MGRAKCLIGVFLLVGCSQNYSEKTTDEALKEKGLQRVDAVEQAPSPTREREEPAAGERASLGGDQCCGAAGMGGQAGQWHAGGRIPYGRDRG